MSHSGLTLRVPFGIQSEFKNRRKSRSRRGNEAEVFSRQNPPLTSAVTILELILLSGFGFRHSSFRSGSVRCKIKDVEIAGIGRSFGGVFGLERFA